MLRGLPASPFEPFTMPRSYLFCSKPFDWLDVSLFPQRGSTYLCCPRWLPVSTGNLTKDSMQEVWNGDAAQSLRRSIHDGSFRHCTSACPFLESVSGPVQRRDDVTDPRLRQLIEKQSTEVQDGPTVVNAAFDRSCNLSCPTCRAEKRIETDSADAILALQDAVADRALQSARILYITGSGDAFGSPYFNRWIRNLDVARLSNLEIIHLHTNALLWTPKMWRQIPDPVRERIRSCEISVDAASSQTYAVNRRGGSFATLLANADHIKALREQGALDYVKIHMVVQANNFAEMPAFVELGNRFAADRIYFSRVANWGTFSGEQFRSIAVHRRDHPEHARLLQVLADPRLEDARVDLGNLGYLVARRAALLARPQSAIGRLIESQIG